jgi:hypothetical protein
MSEKSIFVFFFSFPAFTAIKGQSFMHGAGATVSVMTANISTPNARYTATVLFTNFTYFPRFTFGEKEHSSLSIGVPVGAGIGFNNGGSANASVYYGFDLPLVVDFNGGRKSSPDNEDRFGWYAGAGFGYALTNWTDGSSTEKLNSYGPLFRTGIRFGGGSNRPERATTVGFFFKPGLEKTKFKTFGIAALTEF